MADPLSQEILDKLPEDFVIEVAALPDEAQEQVFDEARAAFDENAIEDFDADSAISRAEDNVDRREHVEDLRQEQAEAVADGDFEAGAEAAKDIQWEVAEIQDAGGEGDEQMLEAERDQAKLETADFEQDTAGDQMEWGANLAASGDLDGAAVQADLAGGHMDTAYDSAGVADQGGTMADQSYDSTDYSTADTSTTE